MKWAVSFPEESILLVRPCLVALCAGNRPAAKLLSVLLYRYSIRQEHKTDAENINEVRAANGESSDQDTTFRIYRKQSQFVTDMCDEITEKTLHDVAVPVLQLFGYLDVDESPAIHCYDVHIDVVVEALGAYKQGPKALEKFLLSHLQLEKFLIDIQLEKFPINKKYFQLALEKVLIANRNFSNNKRGRKPRPEVPPEAQSKEAQISIEIDSKISNRESTLGANAPARAHLKADIEKGITDPRIQAVSAGMIAQAEEDETPTVKMGTVKIGATTHGLDRRSGPDGLLRGASSGVPDAHSRASDARQGHAPTAPVIPKRPRRPVTQEKPQLTLEGQQVKEWYEEVREAKVRMTDKNVVACNRLAEIDGMARDNLKDVIELWDGDRWVKEHNISIDLQELEKPDSKFSFERGLLLVRRKHKGKPDASNGNTPVNDYSLTALLERQAAAEGV